jgi:hypothetical protein
VTGIADSQLEGLPISTVTGYIETTDGPIIGLFNQYAHHGEGKTLHSVTQLLDFGMKIMDRPSQLQDGQQPQMLTPEGYKIPLFIRGGLAYMDMRAPSKKEVEHLPHVIFTSDVEWNPFKYDHTVDEPDSPADEISIEEDEQNSDRDGYQATIDDLFNEYSYTVRMALRESVDDLDEYLGVFSSHELNIFTCIHEAHAGDVDYLNKLKLPRSIIPSTPNYSALRPNFGYLPTDRIKHTLKNTTQWYKTEGRLPLRKHYKTRFPAANVSRTNETVATDPIISDTPAHDDGIAGHGGCQIAQLYTGCTSHHVSVHPMKSEDDMSKTLMDVIRTFGAPYILFSDNSKMQIGKEVLDILRHYCIGHNRSEPMQQNQNPAERRIQDVKHTTNILMDRTGTPAKFWLLCTLFVAYLFNHTSHSSNPANKTPIEMAFGYKPDVSALLAFRWWEPVYYMHDGGYPSESQEKRGRWVGVCENIGDALTYWVLTDDTQKVIARSSIRSALDPMHVNIRANLPENSLSKDGEISDDDGDLPENAFDFGQVVYTRDDLNVNGMDPRDMKLPRFSPEELMGLTFLKEGHNGQKHRAEVVHKIQDEEAENHQNLKFLIKLGDGDREELITYTELSDLIEAQHLQESADPDRAWIYKGLIGHSGPFKRTDAEYQGSKWNVRVKWEDGSETDEPLTVIARDDPVTCAAYAKEHGLLEEEGWKRLKRIARNTKMLERMQRQANLTSQRRGPIYNFGVRVPRDYKEARRLEQEAGHTKWTDAEKAELAQLAEYNTFVDKGKHVEAPKGYKKIRVHFVYACKHDLRHKARLVAGGHLTEPSKESSYSGVVSLRSMRLALVLGELNKLSTMVGDIGNAYLEAYTKEKVYFIAGPEFGALQGHSLVISKALYGLRSSGARFHEKLSDSLRTEGFTPTQTYGYETLATAMSIFVFTSTTYLLS